MVWVPGLVSIGSTPHNKVMAVIRSGVAPMVLETTMASPAFRSARVTFGLRSSNCCRSGCSAVADELARGAHSGWTRNAMACATGGCRRCMLELLFTLTTNGFLFSRFVARISLAEASTETTSAATVLNAPETISCAMTLDPSEDLVRM